MKENERLLLFYEECVKKGYSDMTDPQQALKAKVIDVYKRQALWQRRRGNRRYRPYRRAG